MRQALLALVAIGIVASLAGAGTMAFFNDTETSSGNTFTAGTLDLTVNDQNPYTEHITVKNIKPGWSKTYTWMLKNTGSILGHITVEVGTITSNDNGCTEPEKNAEIDEYGSATCGAGQGELARFIRTQVFQSKVNVTSPIGWGISDQHAKNLTGRKPGGNTYGGLRYIEGRIMTGKLLGHDDFQMVKLVLSLDSDIVNDGAGWWTGHDVVDDIIQSDSVEFDIIFHLEQA